MKLLAGMFGAVALLAALLGFAIGAAPVIALSGKVAALLAMAGLAIVAGTSVARDESPPIDIDADNVSRW